MNLIFKTHHFSIINTAGSALSTVHAMALHGQIGIAALSHMPSPVQVCSTQVPAV